MRTQWSVYLFSFFLPSFLLLRCNTRWCGYERSVAGFVECALFAMSVKSSRDFAKLKRFIQIECTRAEEEKLGDERRECGVVEKREGSGSRAELFLYPGYFCSRHYGHNHLSVPPRQSSLFIDEVPEARWLRSSGRECAGGARGQKVIISRKNLSIVFRIKCSRRTSELMYIIQNVVDSIIHAGWTVFFPPFYFFFHRDKIRRTNCLNIYNLSFHVT